jgi:hypothetical protein
MNLLVTPVAAVLIGLFVRPRLTGVTLYLGIEAVLFTFQTLVVLLAWLSGQGGFGAETGPGAFGPAPTGLPLTVVEGEVWAYGLVNLVIMLVGIGILVGIATLRERRRARSPRLTAPAPPSRS